MFDSRKNIGSKAANAADLMIDFATLGQYGLEPTEQAATPCEARRRPGATPSSGAWRSAIDRFAAHS